MEGGREGGRKIYRGRKGTSERGKVIRRERGRKGEV